MLKPKIIVGPNGLKILICNNNNSLSTSLLILVNVGTDWEEKEKNGIFHFIEHLYFKGTKNYPNSKILMESIDNLGGIYNAFTNHEYTGYYIKVLPEYSFESLKIFSDILLNPLFLESEIEKERNVIFEEINLYQDSPAHLVVDLGINTTFGDQPAGWPILGNKKTISNIRRNDILTKVNSCYSAKNTLIILSGQINNEKKLIEFITKEFKNYNYKKPIKKSLFKSPNQKYQQRIYHKNVEQAHIFLGFPLPGIFSLKKRRIALNMLSIILGEKSSSRLWLRIREELGASYYLRSNFIEYSDRSLFFIHAGIDLNRLEMIIKEICQEIVRLRDHGPEKKELETSKAVLKSNLFIDFEDSLTAARFYGWQYLITKKIQTPQEILKEIDQITIEDLKKELKNIFKFSQAKFAIILPKDFKTNFSKILKKLLE